jgi:hypothetical protein
MAAPDVGVKGIHTVPETNRAWCFYDVKAETRRQIFAVELACGDDVKKAP